MATSDIQRAPVLIVGGGPVGLSLAIELCNWGIQPIVVEKRAPEELIYPTANHLSVRGAEVLRRWGLAARVRENGFPADWCGGVGVFTHIGGHELRHVHKPSNGEALSTDYSPENEMWQPKRYVDPVLREEAVRLGATLLSSAEVTALVQGDDGVTAEVTLLESGETLQLAADYAVGCDGANSRVRGWLGLVLDGLPPEPTIDSVYFRSKDLANQIVQRWHYRLLGNADGPHVSGWMLVAVDGKELWRLHGHGAIEVDDPELTARNLRDIVGIDADIEIISMGSWQLRQAVSPSFRQGRVFLAGDAAARGSTFGGLWMNRGMLDALDLGWKLAATIQGWGGESLLDTYETERRDATLQMLMFQGVDFYGREPRVFEKRSFGHADAVKAPPSELWESGEDADVLRALVREKLATQKSDLLDYSRADVGYRYDGSPIVVDDGSPLQEKEGWSYTPNAKPGGRAPHVALEDGSSTLDWFNQHFTLVALDGAPTEVFAKAATRCGIPLTVQQSDDPRVRELYVAPLTLVRPDGFVAWRGELPSVEHAERLLDTVRGN